MMDSHLKFGSQFCALKAIRDNGSDDAKGTLVLNKGNCVAQVTSGNVYKHIGRSIFQ